MKNLMLIVLSALLVYCTHANKTSWDSGAQKQEAFDDQGYRALEDTTREQFPGTKEMLQVSPDESGTFRRGSGGDFSNTQ